MIEMPDQEIDLSLRPIRIVIGLMTIGLLVLAGLALFLVQTGRIAPNTELAPVLLMALAILIVTEVPAYIIIRQVFYARARAQSSARSDGALTTAEWGRIFTPLSLVGAAMIEGVALFATVIYILTGQVLALAVPGVGLLLLGLLYPSREQFRRFVVTVIGQTDR